MKKKEEKKKKLESFSKDHGIIDKVDEDFTKLMQALDDKEKERIENIAKAEFQKKMESLGSVYASDY